MFNNKNLNCMLYVHAIVFKYFSVVDSERGHIFYTLTPAVGERRCRAGCVGTLPRRSETARGAAGLMLCPILLWSKSQNYVL